MKRELFNKVKEQLTGQFVMASHTIREEFETCNFFFTQTAGIEKIREVKGKTSQMLNSNPLYYCTYITLTYKPEQDKMSLGLFEAGWKWSQKKGRYFPYVTKTPIMCYSKHIYAFAVYKSPRINKIHKINPMLMKIGYTHQFNKTIGDVLRSILNINFKPSLNVLVKYAQGAQDDWDIIFNKTGVRVPKALRGFEPSEVLSLVEVLRNPNELSTICQYLANQPKTDEEATRDPDRFGIWEISTPTIATVVANMMGLQKVWLLRDYMADLSALGKKMSLKMTSEKRIENEHKKMAAARILKGIKSVKVHENYKILKDTEKVLDLPTAELITNKKRLAEESAMQNHCVATYAERINSGSCCIISVMYQDKRYTGEVVSYTSVNPDSFLSTQRFSLNQLRGERNAAAPEELENHIKLKLAEIQKEIAVPQTV